MVKVVVTWELLRPLKAHLKTTRIVKTSKYLKLFKRTEDTKAQSQIGNGEVKEWEREHRAQWAKRFLYTYLSFFASRSVCALLCCPAMCLAQGRYRRRGSDVTRTGEVGYVTCGTVDGPLGAVLVCWTS